jgi:hypothetical protein
MRIATAQPSVMRLPPDNPRRAGDMWHASTRPREWSLVNLPHVGVPREMFSQFAAYHECQFDLLGECGRIGMAHVEGRRSTGNASPARRPWRGLAISLLLLLGAMASAHAQIGRGHGGRQKDQQQTPQKQSPAPTPPAVVPEPWPRLDAGALLCKSRDDLVRYQTQITNGASAATARQASGCHAIDKQTGIRILDADGPSRTQIVTTDEAKQTGWTNTYLPSTPPPSVAKGAGADK